MAEKIQTINLLPQNNQSLTAQILDWALTIGRLLVILTEMVALGTFIYRFGLDMEIVNLHDEIKNDSAIVYNFKDAETTFRDIQDRLKTAKQYTAIDATTTGIFTDIIKMGQGKVTFKDLIVSTQNVKMSLQSPSSPSLSQFIDALKAYPSITAVTLDKVDDNPTSGQITLSVTATLKPVAFAQDQITNGYATNQAILNNQQQ